MSKIEAKVGGVQVVTAQVVGETIVASVSGVGPQGAAGVGPQGPPGQTGSTGATGPQGPSGVITVSAPLINLGTASAASLSVALGNGITVVDGELTADYTNTAFTAAVAAVSPPANWDTLTGKPSTFPPSSHTHDDRYYTESEVDAFLASKQAAGDYATLVGGKVPSDQLPAIVTSYNDLANKPDLSVYLTSVSWDDVGSKPSFAAVATSGAYSDLSGRPTLGSAAAANTTDFAPAGTYATLVGGTVPDSQIASSIARTSDVSSAVAAVVDAAPSSLDTLRELAQALGDDANFASTVTNALAAKAPIASPTFTGTVGGITASMVGLGNVDNTSDANKPVSGAQAAANAAVGSAAAADATSKANAAQSYAVQRGNHTGTQAISTVDGLQTALDGKQAAGSYVLTTDASVTNAREWTADTVTQAEAEAGTATTRRAWTAQRVFQAIAAWWAASTAKAKLDGIASGATANQTDAYLLSRANHTGTQSYTTITGLGTLATQSGTFSGTSSGVNTGDQTILLTGDVTGSGTGSFAATLANSGVTAGSYGSASSVATFTVDAKGRLTSAGSTSIAISSGAVSGLGGAATLNVGTTTGTVAAGDDARFTDSRTPTDGSVTDAKITSGGLSASSINWTAIADWQPSTAYAKGALVNYLGVAYRRSAAGTSGTTFTSTNWQQVTPSEFVGSQITSGTIGTARLGSGTASNATFLRGDGTWAAAGSTNASDLTTGTLGLARLPARARAAINIFSWSSFR